MFNPDDIHARADKERRKEISRRQKRVRGKKGKRFFPVSSGSRQVFHRIYPHGANQFITLFLPLMLFVIGLALYFTDKKNFGFLLPWLWWLPAIPVVSWLLYFIREQIDYKHYKNWRDDLGFIVHGWDELGQHEKFPRWNYWDRNTILRLQLKRPPDAALLKLLYDLLYLCSVAANKTFYEADFVQPGAAGDLRYKWKHTGELEIGGSTNSSVLGELYLFLDKKLRAVQASYDCIESVTIHFSKDFLEVQPVQVSD